MSQFSVRLLAASVLLFLTACGTAKITLIETHYGEESMPNKILVTYATRAGSTAEVADAIGKTLAATGALVDVKPIAKVNSLDGYQAVVLGSAIRAGQLMPEMVNFAKSQKPALSKIPVAFFVVCMTMKDNTEKNRKTTAGYLDPLRQEITPVDIGLFAGKMNYASLGFFARIIAQYMVKVPEGDFRDWNAIQAWASQLAAKLK